MSEVDSALASVQLVGGGCAAGAGLTTCKSSLFESARKSVSYLLVVLMAGKSTDDVSAAAGALKGMKVTMIAVGMGGSFDQSQLTTIASSSSYVLTATSFSGLSGISSSLISMASSGKNAIMFSDLYSYVFMRVFMRAFMSVCLSVCLSVVCMTVYTQVIRRFSYIYLSNYLFADSLCLLVQLTGSLASSLNKRLHNAINNLSKN